MYVCMYVCINIYIYIYIYIVIINIISMIIVTIICHPNIYCSALIEGQAGTRSLAGAASGGPPLIPGLVLVGWHI